MTRSLSTLQLTEPITSPQWTAFVTLQFLDMYTTYRGLKYNCVYEANPLFGERPSVMRMGVRKFLILYPAMSVEMQENILSQDDMKQINFIMSLVVMNNITITNKASKRCIKS